MINKKQPNTKKTDSLETHASGAGIAFYLLFIVLPLSLANFINAFSEPFLKTTLHYIGLLGINLIFIVLFLYNARLSKGFEKSAYLVFTAVFAAGLVLNLFEYYLT